MPQVVAWYCPHSDQYFATKVEYRHHLEQLARMRRARRKQQAYQATIEARLQAMRDTCESFGDIAAFIENNPLLFIASRYDNRPGFLQRGKKFKIYNVEFKNMRFKPLASNTHCAPLGKPENWHCKPDLPSGYPGYYGRIEFSLKNERDEFRFSFTGTGINTGSGGGGNRLGYEVTLFIEDWKIFLRERTMARLLGEW